MQTPAQAGNKASKPEHYQAVAGTRSSEWEAIWPLWQPMSTRIPAFFVVFLLLFRKEQSNVYTSRLVRVILAQGPY